MKYGWNVAITAALAAVVLAGAPMTASAQSQENVVRPGLGEDPGAPETTPFALPPGVRLAGTIRGADEESGECEAPGAEPGGTGVYVRVCVPLENLSGSPVQIEFPAGLVLVATSEGRAQNGLLIERTLVTVPPTMRGGAGCRRVEDERAGQEAQDPCVFVVPLYLYCLNEERDPSSPFITYAFSGVTNDRALREMLSLLDGKAVRTKEQIGLVQEALYNITEGRGLRPQDRAVLNQLPAT